MTAQLASRSQKAPDATAALASSTRIIPHILIRVLATFQSYAAPFNVAIMFSSSARELPDLTLAIATINARNRLSIATRTRSRDNCVMGELSALRKISGGLSTKCTKYTKFFFLYFLRATSCP